MLIEVGGTQVKPVRQSQSQAIYALLRGMLQMSRGYNLISQLEMQRRPLVGGAPTDLKWGVGFFLFPMQRFEVQTQYVITRTLVKGTAIDDASALLLQLHLSL
ncbi:MAG: hypothetical protein HC902_06745 [Calothrix sp. SM1_5_4]|nr:hypothetical protein [Calothrix sp. SM1_5_4]